MSMDTIALFEVPDAQVALRTIYNCAMHEQPTSICAASERFIDNWKIRAWQYDNENNLTGPGGFSLRADGKLVEVYHLLKFSVFATQEDDGRLVLGALYELGQIIDASEMILMHELLGPEGGNLNAAYESLCKQIGPPAKDFSELASFEHFKPGCWMKLHIHK